MSSSADSRTPAGSRLVCDGRREAVLFVLSTHSPDGERIGIQVGEANICLHLMGHRFGTVPDAVRARIEHADPGTLLTWSGRVLTEDSIEDVLR